MTKAQVEIDGVKVYCRYDELVSVGDLMPHPNNPNIHPVEQIEILADIFKNNGIRQPIKVSNLSGFIISGHGRLSAAKIAGLKTFPVEYQDYKDNHEEILDLLGDNKIAELSDLDEGLLKNAIEEANLSQTDILSVGFSQDELDVLNDLKDIPDCLELEKDNSTSTRQKSLVFGNVKLIMTDDEASRFSLFISRYADKNGNYLGIVNELLTNGAKNYEN